MSEEKTLIALKEQANGLGINYHPKIGVEKLRERIRCHIEISGENPADVPLEPPKPRDTTPNSESDKSGIVLGVLVRDAEHVKKVLARSCKYGKSLDSPLPMRGETPAHTANRMKKKSLRLIRATFNNNNENKNEWRGEIIKVGNATTPTQTKFVPFGNEKGYYVPQIMLNALKERQCVKFRNRKLRNGHMTRKAYLANEFSIDIMPQHTHHELDDLAKSQAMRGVLD